jgi:hypothetical protein
VSNNIDKDGMLKFQASLGAVTKVQFPVILGINHTDGKVIGHVSADSAGEAIRDLVELLETVAGDIYRANVPAGQPQHGKYAVIDVHLPEHGSP